MYHSTKKHSYLFKEYAACVQAKTWNSCPCGGLKYVKTFDKFLQCSL